MKNIQVDRIDKLIGRTFGCGHYRFLRSLGEVSEDGLAHCALCGPYEEIQDSDKRKQQFLEIFSKKPIRVIFGVAVAAIAIIWSEYPLLVVIVTKSRRLLKCVLKVMIPPSVSGL